MTRNSTHPNDSIQVNYVMPESKYEGKSTKTGLFLLPFIGINKELLTKRFVNAYVDDLSEEHDYKNPVFLLFRLSYDKPGFKEDWATFENKVLVNRYYRHNYMVGREGKYELYMYVYETPTEYSEDYSRFLNSQYSQFSTTAKKLFKPTIIKDGEELQSLAYRIVNKDQSLKEYWEKKLDISFDPSWELWSKIDTKEYFNVQEQPQGRGLQEVAAI